MSTIQQGLNAFQTSSSPNKSDYQRSFTASKQNFKNFTWIENKVLSTTSKQSENVFMQGHSDQIHHEFRFFDLVCLHTMFVFFNT